MFKELDNVCQDCEHCASFMFAYMKLCVWQQWEPLCRFLFNDGLFWVAVFWGEWGLSPCCRAKYHVCAQRENIPAGPTISSGHSCTPHPHCNGIVLGLSRPVRPPTLQPLASLTALPFSCLSTTPSLGWLMGEWEGSGGWGPGSGLHLEVIVKMMFFKILYLQ